MKGQLRIDEMYAFIVLDDDGTEGIPAFLDMNSSTGLPTMMPCVGADAARVDILRQILLTDPMLRGKRMTLAKFSTRTDVEVLDRTHEPPPSARGDA